MTSLNKNTSGFTIVELLLTIIVGAIIIGSTHVILINQARISASARDMILVNAFSENKIESLRSIGYNGLTTGTSVITSELPSELKAPRSATVSVSDSSDAIKLVALTVTYNDQGASRTYSYSTYVGELGVGQY